MVGKQAESKINNLQKTIRQPQKAHPGERLMVGVDLGTAYIVLVVLGEDARPLCCMMEFANVVKDGLVVDFVGATHIVKRLKAKAEELIGAPITYTAMAVPPGTGEKDQRTFSYVAEGAGMEVIAISDEPTAANEVLGIQDGAIVDIGGGTTGLSILQDGKVVYTADEPTGGTHVSLVIAGSRSIPFDQAEELKKNAKYHKEVFPSIIAVFQKMGTIVRKNLEGRHVQEIYLVGGTSCMEGVEDVIAAETGLPVIKPSNPLLVTPLGIALLCNKASR